MQNAKYWPCYIAFLLAINTGFSQSYKVGDKVEAFINHEWNKARIVKEIPGKSNLYELQLIIANDQREGIRKNILRLNTADIRSLKQSLGAVSLAPAMGEVKFHLGRYDLYAGIPSMYLGHIILSNNGKYKIAFSTDEANYENGSYIFHTDSNSFEWTTGMFKNNSWGGKLVTVSGNIFRIEFNKTTFAESN